MESSLKMWLGVNNGIFIKAVAGGKQWHLHQSCSWGQAMASLLKLWLGVNNGIFIKAVVGGKQWHLY